MKITILMSIFVALITSGCASIETVKEARGQGASRTYSHSYGAVYDAALAAAKTQNLEIIENNKIDGRLVLAHGMTLLSWGERIAVFVKPLAASSTEVEIISKPVLSPLNFPPDWQQIVFDQIDVELRTDK